MNANLTSRECRFINLKMIILILKKGDYVHLPISESDQTKFYIQFYIVKGGKYFWRVFILIFTWQGCFTQNRALTINFLLLFKIPLATFRPTGR